MIVQQGQTVETTQATNYTYDSKGNILNKKEFVISLDESDKKVYTEKANKSYTYDGEWKDKLASYNDRQIIYDVSGNPTNYLGHNLTWTMGR